MRSLFLLLLTVTVCSALHAQQCRFEKSGGKESATYFEAIQWYRNLDKQSTQVLVKEMGMTDAG
ncbi:MAG TPA: hypothetical protein PLT49_13485, partial [Ferruginibacter sp.]|nr:hypothetical protein [Ferruginibacter sp.]